MVLIYTHKTSTRLNYILNFIFTDIHGVEFKIVTDKKDFISSNLQKINYSSEEIENSIQIIPADLLFESNILQKKIKVSDWENMKVFFQTSENTEIPFDIFAASFYLISRYEEYLPFSADQHGRFEANQSLAGNNGFLYDPIVDQWSCKLASLLKEKFPGLPAGQAGFETCKREFKYISTIDIDNAYAYLYKGTVRTIGATMRDLFKLDFDENIKRFQALKGEKDPFDTYGYLDAMHKQYGIQPLWFFLVGNYNTYDKNLPLDNESFQDLIKKVSDVAEIGIHPSYESNKDFIQLKKEFDYLSGITKKDVTRSRQHYLKLLFTETYQNLLKLGIKEDYTLGYATDVGFRAGTCTPFNFYDLYNEKETDLKIIPFQLMDVTLNQYLKLNVEDAVSRIKEIIEKVKAVNGTFVSLWHNESLSDHGHWKGWEIVYKRMLEIIFEK
ncbi:MAG: polysaccharide deacetylase family protein [Bacteroidales bacterium]|nr:polysaccharide deacetylase family protein [Bacteroidales bacterium]